MGGRGEARAGRADSLRAFPGCRGAVGSGSCGGEGKVPLSSAAPLDLYISPRKLAPERRLARGWGTELSFPCGHYWLFCVTPERHGPGRGPPGPQLECQDLNKAPTM